jgi:hypothetical protein
MKFQLVAQQSDVGHRLPVANAVHGWQVNLLLRRRPNDRQRARSRAFRAMMDEQLRPRPTVIAGATALDDYQVFWNALPIGRILKQPGVPKGRPNRHWSAAFPGRHRPSSHRGNCSDIAECKRRFKVVWTGIRPGLSEADIEAARLTLDAADRRPKWPGR